MSDISNTIAYYVRELRDFPDGNIIQHITQLAMQHISSASQVVDVITSTLVDQRTPSSYKKPLFYLIDSILKKAGGPYNYLFQQRFQSAFPSMVANISAEDRKKLDFLFGTWSERKLFSDDFLSRLKSQLANFMTPPIVPSMQPMLNQNFNNASSNFMQSTNVMTSNMPSSSVPAKEEYERLVQAQMQRVMQEIFAGLDTSATISLDELRLANPDLFQQIRSQAENDAKIMWRQRISIPIDSSKQQKGSFPYQQINPQQSYSHNQSQRGGQYPNQKRGIDDVYSNSSNMPDNRNRFTRSTPVNVVPNNNIAINFPTSNVVAPSLDIPTDIVKGFISEVPVLVDLQRVRNITDSLSKITQQAFAPKVPTAVLESVAFRLSQRLAHYVDNAMIPPPLPDVLAEVNSMSSSSENVTPNIGGGTASGSEAQQPPKPEFKLADFDRNPEIKDRGVFALYGGEQFTEDGLRFKTAVELLSYTDSYLEKKKLLMKKKDQRERLCREWNCTLEQWVTNFGELKKVQVVSNQGGLGGASGGSGSGDEEYIVPADEHFVRCPISHEVFQQDWDYEAGENIFHNAVRVLVTEAGDPNIVKVAETVYVDTPSGISTVDGVKYLIVHKPLVMDRWLAEGKAKTLLEVLQHLKEQQHSTYAIDLIDRLMQAAGDDDEEDVFVILDDTMR